MEASTTKARRAWLAALLSLFGGASGQVYCGHLRRGIVLWLLITFIIHVAASSCAAALPIGRIGLALLLVLCVLTYPVFMRVVGLPGDEIEIRSEQVFVNGTKWDDEHANFSGKVLLPEMANYGHFSVPLDAFFVLGDNRRNANDSRFNGPIPLSDLIGRANIIYWSRERKNIVPGYSMRYEPGPIAWDRIGICFD